MRDVVLERIAFDEPATERKAMAVAAEAIRRHPDATGAVLVERWDVFDKVAAVEIVYRRPRAEREPMSEDMQRMNDSYAAAVVEPRRALREQAAADREARREARRVVREESATEPDSATAPLPTDAEIEAAAQADAIRDAMLYPVNPTPQVQRAKMTARERNADTRARAAAQKARMAEVLAERKAQRLAERDAKRDTSTEAQEPNAGPVCTRCGASLSSPNNWFPSYAARGMCRCKACCAEAKRKAKNGA